MSEAMKVVRVVLAVRMKCKKKVERLVLTLGFGIADPDLDSPALRV